MPPDLEEPSREGVEVTGLQGEDLVRLARMPMPFGKYQGRPLIDLPEAYLLWFARGDGFPRGQLGRLMELCLAIKIEGLEGLVRPLKHSREPRSRGE